MSLTVAYAKETGHVLGALAVSGPVAGGDPFGAALPLWISRGDGTVVDLSVPSARLAAAVVDDEPGALVAPRDYGVAAGGGALRQLAPWSGGIALAADGLTVTVPRPVAERSAVLVAVAGRTPLLDAIAAGETSVTIGARFDTGQYGLLVLVAGWVGRLELAEPA